MDNLDFVRPIIDDNINYREDQKELIEKAMEISDGDKLIALNYIASCLIHEGHKVEFELVFQIPANTKATINLPIVESNPPDELGYYVSWNNHLTHNKKSHTFEPINEIKEYNVRFFGLGIVCFGSPKVEEENEVEEEKEVIFNLETNYYRKCLTQVVSFGFLGHTFTSLRDAFAMCKNNFTVPEYLPSTVLDLSYMFFECSHFNQPLNTWSVNNVLDMNHMFDECWEFNQPLNDWLVYNVLDMHHMFTYCAKFNQPLSWNTSKVKDMFAMFNECTNLNQVLQFDTSNVINMGSMFRNCISFNQPLHEWTVNNVTDMESMFWNCTNFNQPLNTWSVNNVTTMEDMFCYCTNFNQPLATWSVNNVKYISGMFRYCTNFNQPLTTWNVDNVIGSNYVFVGCNISEENEPIFEQ